MALLYDRVPIEKSLLDQSLTESEKKKLELAVKTRNFAESVLHLNVSKNYTTFVKLNRPYVTYLLTASPKWKLEAHSWYFPIVGRFPYKGFFNESEAKEEEVLLAENDLDSHIRGVSAYSTLGWFNDPITSAMLRYQDHDLVNTIIHESVHATLFIKHEVDFNERLAVFLGNKGMELFYLNYQGAHSKALELAQKDSEDERLFALFMADEIKKLDDWYKNSLESKKKSESERQKQFELIKKNFLIQLVPKLKTKSYLNFIHKPLNNAHLVSFKTYYQDLSDFEQLYSLNENNFDRFMSTIKSLETHKNPSQGLKEIILNFKKSDKK